MKKFWITFFMVIGMAFVLTACGSDKAWFKYGQEEYEINYEEGTVIINYKPEIEPIHFTLTKNGSEYRCDITYPDGSTYWEKQTKSKNSDGIVYIYKWQEGKGFGYGEGFVKQSLPEHTLADAIIDNAVDKPATISFGRIAMAIVIAGVGIWQISSPESAWHWGYGWHFKNEEPSEASLALGQISGVVMLIMAVIVFITSCAA